MINFKEVDEKDLSVLARLYSAIYLNIKIDENWDYDTALNYMYYFYNSHKDLFVCAYDDSIAIGAIMSTLKPYYDGIHLAETELFVSEDYRGKKIGRKLLELQLELANSKYNATTIDAITYINNPCSPLEWYKRIGFEVDPNFVVLHGNINNCLKNIKK